MEKEMIPDVQLTLSRLPEMMCVLKPMFVTLTYFDGDLTRLPKCGGMWVSDIVFACIGNLG
jgi:hypothetical protein